MTSAELPPLGSVLEVTHARQYPVVLNEALDASIPFDVSLIHDLTVTIYPPDVVILMRVIDGGAHTICRSITNCDAGGPLCVISVKHLKRSEATLS